MFNEYFHGDNPAGLGASHQTGCAGMVADVIRRPGGALHRRRDPDDDRLRRSTRQRRFLVGRRWVWRRWSGAVKAGKEHFLGQE